MTIWKLRKQMSEKEGEFDAQLLQKEVELKGEVNKLKAELRGQKLEKEKEIQCLKDKIRYLNLQSKDSGCKKDSPSRESDSSNGVLIDGQAACGGSDLSDSPQSSGKSSTSSGILNSPASSEAAMGVIETLYNRGSHDLATNAMANNISGVASTALTRMAPGGLEAMKEDYGSTALEPGTQSTS